MNYLKVKINWNAFISVKLLCSDSDYQIKFKVNLGYGIANHAYIPGKD